MSRDYVSNAATGLLVACALAITATVVRRELFAPAPPRGPNMNPRPVANWARLVADGRWQGRSNAPVRIVEFSDFQCPFCARTHPAVEAVQRKHPDRVAVLFRHFPLQAIHPYARPAAVAAECAADQGRFAELASLLFAQQDSLGAKPWSRFAAAAGVADSVAFERCVRESRTMPRVDHDAKLGVETDLEVTPTLVVNGTMYPGTITEAALDSLVARAAPR
jgi:protein-disulfide isomerase